MNSHATVCSTLFLQVFLSLNNLSDSVINLQQHSVDEWFRLVHEHAPV